MQCNVIGPVDVYLLGNESPATDTLQWSSYFISIYSVDKQLPKHLPNQCAHDSIRVENQMIVTIWKYFLKNELMWPYKWIRNNNLRLFLTRCM